MKLIKQNTDGLTLKELREIIDQMPDEDPLTGEPNEVWIGHDKRPHGTGLSSPATEVAELGRGSIIFEAPGLMKER